MLEITGDFWEEAPNYNVLVCPINLTLNSKNELVMGAGLAKQFKERFPNLSKDWGDSLYRKQNGNLSVFSFKILIHSYKKWGLIGLPTKFHWKDNSDLSLMENGIEFLGRMSFTEKVLLTRVGCGLGGLSWLYQVKPLLSKYLNDQFTIIHPK